MPGKKLEKLSAMLDLFLRKILKNWLKIIKNLLLLTSEDTLKESMAISPIASYNHLIHLKMILKIKLTLYHLIKPSTLFAEVEPEETLG